MQWPLACDQWPWVSDFLHAVTTALSWNRVAFLHREKLFMSSLSRACLLAVISTLALRATVLAADTTPTTFWPDPQTHLMWTGSDNGSGVTWAQADTFCHTLQLSGFSDWRMPTIDELMNVTGVVDGGQTPDRTIHHTDGINKTIPGQALPDYMEVSFTKSKAFWLWSSTPAGTGTVYSINMGVGFHLGKVTSKLTDHIAHRTFCVRTMDQQLWNIAQWSFPPGPVASVAVLQSYLSLRSAEALSYYRHYPFSVDGMKPAADQPDPAQAMKNLQQAVTDFQQALALQPNWFQPLKEMGLAQLAMEDWAGAADSLAKARKLDKGDGDVRVALGVAQNKLKGK